MKRNITAILILSLLFTALYPYTVWADPEEENDPIILEVETPDNTPDQVQALEEPTVNAEGAVIIEQKTGKVLYAKNEHEKLYPASTTKILTALLALEDGDLNETITVGNEANLVHLDGSKAGLDLGEEISLKNLVTGLLLPSGNDAALTIAVYVARKVKNNNEMSISQALDVFAELMNEKMEKIAQENGIPNESHFVNPHGYHDNDHYITALDIGMVAREAMKNETFREIVKTYAYDYPDWNGVDPKDSSKKEIRYWRNHNKLILNREDNPYYYPYATGIKTGYTSLSGQCLVSSGEKDGMEVVAVVLKTDKEGQWLDSIKLLDYGLNNFEYHEVLKKDQLIKTIQVENHAADDTGELQLIAVKEFSDVFQKADIPNIKENIEINPDIAAPITKGTVLGKVTYTLGDQVLVESDLTAGRDMEKKSILNIIPGKGAKAGSKEGGLAWYWIAAIVVILLILLRTFIVVRRRRRNRRYLYRRRY